MFGISFSEILLILVIVLLVFGPEKLPEMASNLGKLFGQFKKSTDEIRRDFYNSVYTPSKLMEKDGKSLTESLKATPKKIVREIVKKELGPDPEQKEDKSDE